MSSFNNYQDGKNMHSSRISFIILFIGVVLGRLNGQEVALDYPSMKNVLPTVTVTVDRNQSLYKYEYRVSNGARAAQRIWKFMVQVRTDSFATAAPTSWSGGSGRRSNIITGTWASLDSTVDIWPGTSRDSLAMTSGGLPSIVKYYAIGFVEPPEGEIEITPGTGDILMNSFQALTIGPASPRVLFDSIAFIDTLKSYVARSRTLGWITNQDTANRYTTLIDSVKAQIQRGDEQKARLTLDRIIANTERDNGGALSSEAYALLKCNSEYLRSRLH